MVLVSPVLQVNSYFFCSSSPSSCNLPLFWVTLTPLTHQAPDWLSARRVTFPAPADRRDSAGCKYSFPQSERETAFTDLIWLCDEAWVCVIEYVCVMVYTLLSKSEVLTQALMTYSSESTSPSQERIYFLASSPAELRFLCQNKITTQSFTNIITDLIWFIGRQFNFEVMEKPFNINTI